MRLQPLVEGLLRFAMLQFQASSETFVQQVVAFLCLPFGCGTSAAMMPGLGRAGFGAKRGACHRMSDVSESGSPPGRRFSLPASQQELWALVLSILAVFLLVQIGAPLIRRLEFLDPKIRDYFIGMSFAAFPFILDAMKAALRNVRLPEPSRLEETAAWYASGVVAGALLFAWNQFVSFLAWLSLSTYAAVFPDPSTLNVPEEVFVPVQMMALLAVVVPLCAVAGFLAGLHLNRHTRSHVGRAVVLAALFFLVANTTVNWVTNPEITGELFSMLLAGGADGFGVLVGMSGVGVVILGATAAGVVVSRMRRERQLGEVVGVLQRLSGDRRDLLVREILLRARELEAAGSDASHASAPETAA